MKIVGHHDFLRLRHGPNVRMFRDVEVVSLSDPDQERYELTGVETEVTSGEERQVTVGFFDSHLVKDGE